MTDVVLVWFESVAPGSAAGQHLTGTLQRLEEAGVVVPSVVAEHESVAGWPARLGRLLRVQARAVRAGGRHRLLLVRWHPAALIPLLVQRLRGGKSVLMVQGNIADMETAYPFTARLPFIGLLARSSLSLGDAYIAPTKGIVDWMRDELGITGRNFSVIENGFDGDAVREVAPLTHEELEAAGVRLGGYAVFVGKFARWQGVDVILASVASSGWPEDLPVVFVGDGSEAAAVAEAARRIPLVRCIGRVPPATALAWTMGAAIALAPRKSGPASDRGVSPYKVLEACALGTPLVASRVRGQGDMVTALGIGVLVNPDSPEELAEAVARLWQDPSLRRDLSLVGLHRADRYAWRARSRDLLDVLKSVDRITQ